MSEDIIFKEGDVVYHPYFGRGVVSKTVIDGIAVTFIAQENIFSKGYALAVLSFSEWTSPNHVRPLKNGVYKVKYNGDPTVLANRDGVWYFVDTSYSRTSTHMAIHRVNYQEEVSDIEFLYPT